MTLIKRLTQTSMSRGKRNSGAQTQEELETLKKNLFDLQVKQSELTGTPLPKRANEPDLPQDLEKKVKEIEKEIENETIENEKKESPKKEKENSTSTPPPERETILEKKSPKIKPPSTSTPPPERETILEKKIFQNKSSIIINSTTSRKRT